MTVDYDKPRAADTDDLAEASLDDLKRQRAVALSAVIDVDESNSAEFFEPPGADLSGEELLLVKVLPKQKDEFTCSSCFLVHHRSRLASDKGGQLICNECA
jgi:hypothetical protein